MRLLVTMLVSLMLAICALSTFSLFRQCVMEFALLRNFDLKTVAE